jgi:Uma2 family endonuclease
MALTKPTGSWTYEDLFSLPDDGRRYEIIEGVLFEMPSPTLLHAVVMRNLVLLLSQITARLGGELFFAPLDVFFAGANPVQPDILVILRDGSARPVARGIEGPPDLIVEILSPSNRVHDLLTKRALYGRAGVREYWIVDPENQSIELLTPSGDALVTTPAASGVQQMHSPLLDSTISLTAVFAGLDRIEN